MNTKVDSSNNANNWGYGYNAWGQMTCAKAASTTCTSGATRTVPTYDALDRVVSSTYNGTTTTNSFRGRSETLTRQAISGSTTTAYDFAADGTPIAEKGTTTNPFFYLRDPHGDVVGSVTTAASNQSTRSFDPYGKVLATTQVSGSEPVLGYQGDPTDPVTKLVDMGTRYYMPTTDRFMNRDSVAGDPTAPMSMNRYAYANMSPLTMFDPTGKAGCEIGLPPFMGPDDTELPEIDGVEI